jgi:hypothetical protein
MIASAAPCDDGDLSEPVLRFLNANEVQTIDIITLQSYLFDLTDATFASALSHILCSSWIAHPNRIAELSQMLKNAIVTSIRAPDIYVRLLVELTRRATSQDHLSALPHAVISSLGLTNTSSALFVLGMIDQGLTDAPRIARLVLNHEFNYFAFFFFAPEIEAFNAHSFSRRQQEIERASANIREHFRSFDEVRKDGWRVHLELRRKGHNPWLLAELIESDNVDAVQSFMALNFVDINARIPPSFYQHFSIQGIPASLSLIAYAALFGSVKCFRFLLLGRAHLEKGVLGHCAIIGNNPEIVRLCEQREAIVWNDVSFHIAIRFHRFAIFAWMCEGSDGLLPLRTHEILNAAVSASNFEVFAYNMLHAQDLTEVMAGMTFRVCYWRSF